MNIALVTPAPPGSRQGNRITALRWRRLLRELGHQARVLEEYRGGRFDLLVALHARKSAPAVRQFLRQCPGKPVVLVWTGTDLNLDLPRHRLDSALLAAAARHVVLHPAAVPLLPEELRDKARVVLPSAMCPRKSAPRRSGCNLSLAGHLRAIKNPFLIARATLHLPAESGLRVRHMGAALEPSFAKLAREWERKNSRYTWMGDLPHARCLREISRSQALVLTSQSEGAPTCVVEALVCGVPVLATRIAGTEGLLGPNYPGLFPPGNVRALRAMLLRFEADAAFRGELSQACRQLQSRFSPVRERAAWQSLLRELAAPVAPGGRSKPC